MSLNLKQLEAFVAVADLGSFRRAADTLNTIQPNISARIANLETRLGLSLMDRDAGSVRLTARGKTLLGQARVVLQEVDTLLVKAGDDTLFEGILRLGVTELVAHVWLRQFLIAMKERFPNVLVELTVDLSSVLSEALHARDLDLAFQNGPFNRAISGVVLLGCHGWQWVAAPAMQVKSGLLNADDIVNYPILTHARGTVPYQQLAGHFSASTKARARLVPSSNLASCLQMSLDGLGICCLPKSMVEDAVASGALERLNYPWVPEELCFEARFDQEITSVYVAHAADLAKTVAEEALV